MREAVMPPWLKLTKVDKTFILSIYVQPQAKTTAIAGEFNGMLKIKVAAPPVDGAANEAVTDWIAQKLGIRSHDIQLIRGQTSRIKVFEVSGIEAHEILEEFGV